ncbi:MAG: hypothetical protein Q7S29_05300 [Candidatus Peribacter sp.]|nr:hypothetical protein [Candidatus Peribacter sp.]
MSEALYIAKKSGRVQVCVTDLPASIEAYLIEAGFSQTEIMALKKLLEGEALTLRELAAKTGKSTGVLDQAVKKLLSRRILCRETVNDTPKMIIKSLEPILQWVKRDTEEKLETMKSRARNFETFINSLKVENKRPEISYFEGEEGIKKAYLNLLELPVKEFLHYRPVTTKEEEDPLREFRVQYFRGRHKRSIFSRVLAPNTPLGRRFQSRDAFEYRETQLLKDEEFPITFEKIIANGTVACFNHAEQRACYLKYPELAHTERTMFELLWRRAKEPLTQSQTVSVIVPQGAQPIISMSTRSLSSLREFFLSRKSVWIFLAGAVLAAGVTYGLWRHNIYLNTQRLKEQAKAIAATAAPEFVVEDINKIHKASDMETDSYQRVFKKLNEIRNSNPSVQYSYIMRLIDKDRALFEFVADADSNYDFPVLTDSNQDGALDEADENSGPGVAYDASLSRGPSLESLIRPMGIDAFPDQWGSWISGWAPIKDSAGKTVAIFGVDIKASDIANLTYQSFKPLYYFFGLFFFFVFIRLAAFNRPLFFELLKWLRSRGVLTVLGVCALIALGVTYGMYRYTLGLMKEQVGEKLMAIASTAAAEIEAKDLEQLRYARDMKRPEYQKVFKKLNEIRDLNENVKWVYVMRPTEEPTIWEFVVDANANYFIPLYDKDLNNNGINDEEDENVSPGVRYDTTGQILSTSAWRRPFYETASDQWGIVLSGAAPIFNLSNKPVAVLGIDMVITDFYRSVQEKYAPFMWFLSTLGALMIVGVGFSFWRR